MTEFEPHLIADVTLYSTVDGGRKGPLRGDLHEWFGCPCKLQKSDEQAWDCRFLIKGLVVQPGETRRLGMIFLSREMALPIFTGTGRFYLWEGRIIGEAEVLEPAHQS